MRIDLEKRDGNTNKVELKQELKVPERSPHYQFSTVSFDLICPYDIFSTCARTLRLAIAIAASPNDFFVPKTAFSQLTAVKNEHYRLPNWFLPELDKKMLFRLQTILGPPVTACLLKPIVPNLKQIFAQKWEPQKNFLPFWYKISWELYSPADNWNRNQHRVKFYGTAGQADKTKWKFLIKLETLSIWNS